MEFSAIKEFRRQRGWTQWDLAEKLGVDQGTVSRWERGIETPRPATSARLRDMVLFEDDLMARKLCETRVRHSISPAVLVGANSRLLAFNPAATRKYQKDFGFDLNSHLGIEWERHAEILSTQSMWKAFVDSRFLQGELLLARFFVNKCGKGHVTQYDPVFELGKLSGFSGTVIGTFTLPPNQDHTVERVEVIHADDPDKIVEIYRGSRAADIQLG